VILIFYYKCYITVFNKVLSIHLWCFCLFLGYFWIYLPYYLCKLCLFLCFVL